MVGGFWRILAGIGLRVSKAAKYASSEDLGQLPPALAGREIRQGRGDICGHRSSVPKELSFW
jgi:hypothetical protein